MAQANAVPTSREQLWSLLAEAAEIEHHLMCCYLYAAFSLKESPEEGLTEEELDAVQRWRSEILSVAVEEMGHLTMVCNILSSVGAPAHLAHQNFPIPPGYHPAGVVVKLTPFNQATLDHFIYLERPEGSEVPDGAGFEPPQHYLRLTSMDRLMTVGIDYSTVGQLYHCITEGMKDLAERLGADALFVGNPDHQIDAGISRLAGVKTVRCMATALCAIDAIVRQGEGADAGEQQSHFQRFVAIQREYEELLRKRPQFRPARMSAHNPVMRRPPTPGGKLWITEEPAAGLLDLGNAMYNHCLRCLSLAYAGLGRDTQATLVAAGVELMHLLTPVACRLGSLPANPELPEATAGLSFATIRSSAALMCTVTSVELLIERLQEIADRSARIAQRCESERELMLRTQAGIVRLIERLRRHATQLREQPPAGKSAKAQAPAAVAHAAPVAAPAAPAVAAAPPAANGAPQPIPLDEQTELIPGAAIDLVYSGKRCIHARHCVLGLPQVFIANVVGPWIAPDAASTEALVTVAHMCPSGAIGYRRHDGGEEEAPPPVNLVQIRENGPLGIRAEIVLDGQAIGMRAVLCRCGASKNKPFCDGSHNDIKFQATGEPATVESTPLAARNGPLRIDPETNGPLVVSGNLEICCGTGRTINRVTAARLCRCGGSSNKPYCDNTHRRNGFRS